MPEAEECLASTLRCECGPIGPLEPSQVGFGRFVHLTNPIPGVAGIDGTMAKAVRQGEDPTLSRAASLEARARRCKLQ